MFFHAFFVFYKGFIQITTNLNKGLLNLYVVPNCMRYEIIKGKLEIQYHIFSHLFRSVKKDTCVVRLTNKKVSEKIDKIKCYL